VYHVRIDLTVPGDELVVSRDPGKDQAHEDVYVAIRDAFDAARRQLEDHARQQRLQVKTHEPTPLGVIVELQREEGFGIIETPDGRRLQFGRDSVRNADFDRLEPGESVRFDEEMSENGPQASTVRVQ
jgi:cold shock CspA family protein